MRNESTGVHGAFIGTLIKKDGTVEVFRKDNLVLNTGIDALCDCLSNSTQPSPFKYIAVGTGTTEPEATQTGLDAWGMIKEGTYLHTDGTSFFTLTAEFGAGEATGALTEAGICNKSSGGAFFDRVVFPVINKGEDDIYSATFKITFTRA